MANKAASPELKPCPFCGGESGRVIHWSAKDNCWFCYYKCKICGSRGKTVTLPLEDVYDQDNPDYELAETCNDARAAWNMRRDGNLTAVIGVIECVFDSLDQISNRLSGLEAFIYQAQNDDHITQMQ